MNVLFPLSEEDILNETNMENNISRKLERLIWHIARSFLKPEKVKFYW